MAIQYFEYRNAFPAYREAKNKVPVIITSKGKKLIHNLLKFLDNSEYITRSQFEKLLKDFTHEDAKKALSLGSDSKKKKINDALKKLGEDEANPD